MERPAPGLWKPTDRAGLSSLAAPAQESGDFGLADGSRLIANVGKKVLEQSLDGATVHEFAEIPGHGDF